MGRLWVTVNGKRKRTKAGIKHESRVITFKLNSFFQSSEIVSQFLSPMFSPIWESSITPRRSVAPFNECDVFFSRNSMTANRKNRVRRISFWINKTKIAPSVIEPIPVDVVYKDPSIRWLANYIVMNKIGLEPSIPIITKVQPFTFIKSFPNVFINFSVSHKFIFVIVKRSLNKFTVNYSFLKNAFTGNWRKNYFAICSFSANSSSALSSFYRVFVWHIRIILRISKFHNMEVING